MLGLCRRSPRPTVATVWPSAVGPDQRLASRPGRRHPQTGDAVRRNRSAICSPVRTAVSSCRAAFSPDGKRLAFGRHAAWSALGRGYEQEWSSSAATANASLGPSSRLRRSPDRQRRRPGPRDETLADLARERGPVARGDPGQRHRPWPLAPRWTRNWPRPASPSSGEEPVLGRRRSSCGMSSRKMHAFPGVPISSRPEPLATDG